MYLNINLFIENYLAIQMKISPKFEKKIHNFMKYK